MNRCDEFYHLIHTVSSKVIVNGAVPNHVNSVFYRAATDTLWGFLPELVGLFPIDESIRKQSAFGYGLLNSL